MEHPQFGKGKERLMPEISAEAHESERDHRSGTQHSAGEVAAPGAGDDQQGSQNRNDGPPARKWNDFVERENRKSDQRNADQRPKLIKIWVTQSCPAQGNRQECARKQLPTPGRQEEEIRRRGISGADLSGSKTER